MKNKYIFFTLAVFLTIFFAPVAVSAADVVPPTLSVSIGGLKSFNAGIQNVPCNGDSDDKTPGNQCYAISWIGQYVGAIFQYGVGMAAALSVIMIMVGGFLWLTSGGSPDKVGKAKDFITSSLLGLFLALFSYVLLYALNPRLVNIEPLKVAKVTEQQQFCCKSAGVNTYQMVTLGVDAAHPEQADCSTVGNYEPKPVSNTICEVNYGCCIYYGQSGVAFCAYQVRSNCVSNAVNSAQFAGGECSTLSQCEDNWRPAGEGCCVTTTITDAGGIPITNFSCTQSTSLSDCTGSSVNWGSTTSKTAYPGKMCTQLTECK